MNVSLQVFLNPPSHELEGQKNAARYKRGDVIAVYETESLADWVDNEFRHKDEFSSKWVFLHITETNRTLEQIRASLMCEATSVEGMVRRRKMMVDPANISESLFNKLKLHGEVTVSFSELFPHLKNKEVTEDLDAEKDNFRKRINSLVPPLYFEK
jgi:hypothetical protein